MASRSISKTKSDFKMGILQGRQIAQDNLCRYLEDILESADDRVIATRIRELLDRMQRASFDDFL